MSHAAAGTAALSARIGPNAITRVAEVLLPRCGQEITAAVFRQAGLSGYLVQAPDHMVDEAEVTRLHQALRAALGATLATEVAREAGTRTADYLLARRIPTAAQALLKWLPAPLAARVLLKAIRGHAWTFAGSGHFSARCRGLLAGAGAPAMTLEIRHNPLCRGSHLDTPACAFYSATFERLFRVLVHRNAGVTETQCESCGADCCRFEIAWARSDRTMMAGA
jgi:divinyl protochlorophyllide a 8-vinyl-reductase